MTKKKSTKYRFLPEKEAEKNPWDKLCVNTVGPYNFEIPGIQKIILRAVTMIDPATGLF